MSSIATIPGSSRKAARIRRPRRSAQAPSTGQPHLAERAYVAELAHTARTRLARRAPAARRGGAEDGRAVAPAHEQAAPGLSPEAASAGALRARRSPRRAETGAVGSRSPSSASGS